MPQYPGPLTGKQRFSSIINFFPAQRLLLLVAGVAMAIAFGIVVVRSADLSDPVILPGDLAIGSAPGMQYSPRVARGGNQYLAVWTDNRTVISGQVTGIGAPTSNPGSGSLDDIYAARLDANGNTIDQLPIIISQAQYNQGSPRVGWNGQNWLVAWQTQLETNPSYTEIRAVRVSPDGAVLDAVPLVLASPLSLNSVRPESIVSDGINWIVMWEGFPPDDVDRAVYISRVTPVGVVLDPGGKEIYKHPSSFLDAPRLAFGGDGYLLTLVDVGFNSLYGLRFDLNFAPQGELFSISPEGSPVGSAKSSLAFNGQYYLAVWENGFPQNTGSKLVGSRVSLGGQLMDQSPIIIVNQINDYAPQLDVCGDSGMWYTSFERSSGPVREVRLARLTADGAPLDLDGFSVRPGDKAALTPGVNGGAQVVFHNPSFDPSYSTSHVEGASVSSVGIVVNTTPVSLGVPRQTRPRIVPGTNGYMAVFRSETGNDSRILAQRLDANANPIDAEPIVIAGGSQTNSNPSVAFNGIVYLVVWQASVSTPTFNGWQTLGRRVTPEGIVIDAVPFVIMNGEQPDVAGLGETFLVANILQSGSQKRYVQSVPVSALGVVGGTPTRLDFNFNFFPRVAAFGSRWLVVWQSHANHDDSPAGTFGAFVEQNGSTLGRFSVGGGRTPHLAVAGTTALVVWSNGNIHGRRINADGTFLDPSAGYAITTAANTQSLPAVAWDGTQYMVDWLDHRNESYPVQPRGDIYGARVSVTNIPLEEFPIASSQLPEDSPFVVASNGVSIFAYAKFYDAAPYKSHRITLQTARFAAPNLGTIPAAPTNLVATEPGGNPYANQLTWVDNSNNERGFKLEYKIGSTGAWSQFALVGPDVTTYTLNSVNINGPAYYYRVRAQGLAGDSAYSNETVPTNQPPTVSITSPADGTTYRAPALLVVNATAADSNGTISQVEFFNGPASWGTDTSSPYTTTRFNVPPGTYLLRAVATDNRGAMTTSAPVTVTVTPQNNSLIWSQSGDNQSIIGPSIKTQVTSEFNPPANQEVADDFDITGNIERVILYGYRDFSAPRNPVVHGIYVRFYEWVNGSPGVLQSEQFIASGHPNLFYDAADVTMMDVQLPTPFSATGKHFMSVQLLVDDVRWFWVSSRTNAPRNSAVYLRDNLGGGVWTHPINGDGVFSLYGTLTGSARIDGLSVTSITRSDRLIINGANFGGTQDASRVLIGGTPAQVVKWGDSSIRVYVPEAALLGPTQVQVETVNGLSNAFNLEVKARQQDGRIKWRFPVDGGYVYGSAAVSPDGTVSFMDDEGQLYSLTADGGLKWIAKVGRFGTDNYVSAGTDGTLYVASNAQPGGIGTPIVGAVTALNPDGTQKWKFVAPESTGVTIGPDQGPDGKIYVLFKPPSSATASTPMLNLAALAPEDGHLVWNYYDRYGTAATSGKTFGFDAELGRIYFQINSLTSSSGALFAHRLDTGARENYVAGTNGHTQVAPDHSVHTNTKSYSPQLTLNWTIPLFGQGPTRLQDVGPDSVHYLVQNYYRLYAINPNGTEKWHFDDCVSGSSCRDLDDPVISPVNHVVFVPGLLSFGQPGFFLGLNPANGTELWRVPLPTEPGYGEYGQVRPNGRAVFSPDGQTAYSPTDTAANYDFTYFYAVDTSPTLPCSVTISPTSRNFPANGGNGQIAVSATSGTCSWNATSSANWIIIVNGSGTGNGTATYKVTASNSTEQRSGTITISGQVFTVTQAGVLPDSPTVSITYPIDNQTFQQPTNIFVAAEAQAAQGRTLARVDFYADTQLIGSDSTAPYLIVWNNPATATYALTARAIDNLGTATDSAPITITLLPPTNPSLMPLPVPPPTVTSPQPETTYTAPATITIEATRNPSNYPTFRMEFYVGTTLVGTDTSAPYSFTLTDLPAGRYSLSVRNVANTGARATSQPFDITVNEENFDIAGQVLNNDGEPMGGVQVTLNGSNFNAPLLSLSSEAMLRSLAQSGSVTVITDANGNYTFNHLPESGNYTIAPTANGVTFYPAQAAFSGLHSDSSAVFVAGGNTPQAPIVHQTSDFDGDRKSDIAVWQSSSGIWHIINSGNGAQRPLQQWGLSVLNDLAAPGDYDGDGKTDIAVFRPDDGNWYILQSSTGASTIQGWGNVGDRPVPADYDGDGKTDVAVFRPAEGNWYVLKSTGGSLVHGWGDPTDKVVPGDYDGDGKADYAVYRPSEGNWYIVKSTGGTLKQNWGLSEDRPVPGDYDGDGKTDIAVYRPSEGNWYILKSTGGSLRRNWGDTSDRPVPGDYDGDGKTDIAVWRPSEANWYVILSGTNSASVQYLGASGDIPIPAAFIPQ